MLSLDDQPGSRGFMNVLSWCGGDGGLKYRGVWWQLGCRARGGEGGGHAGAEDRRCQMVRESQLGGIG